MANFSSVPQIRAPRSRFDLSFGHKTSASVGDLVPIYCQEIYPGDTFNCKASFVGRLTSSYLRPVMDNLFVDINFFFVPSRLVYDKWAQIFGENRESAWAQTEEVVAPTIERPEGYQIIVKSHSVGDHLGLPIEENLPTGISILPFRAFAKIYDDWYRDQNLIDPMYIHTGDWDFDELPNGADWSPSNYVGNLPKVAKFHDIFTSSLPGTQKSANPIELPLGKYAKVVPVGTYNDPDFHFWDNTKANLTFATGKTSSPDASYEVLYNTYGITGNAELRVGQESAFARGDTSAVGGWNMYADLSDAGILSVPDLRYAFQLQRILERSARSGTRYTEYLLSAFGVQSPDARLQRTEYLGGKRVPLSVQQVAQTTRGEDEDTKLGSLGAFSLSNGQTGYQKGFVEHGFVIGVLCIRQHHTYQQGVEKFWQRSSRFSFYDPALASISEVPVYRSEVFAAGEDDVRDNIFGYQEAWYDLRYRPSMVSGDMRTDAQRFGASTSLDIWHYADDYANAPTLNQDFVEETPEFVDRTIAVPSTSIDQFIFDLYFSQTAIRRLPTYSVPGLIDHR